MKDILSKAFRIMGIYIIATVIVSVIYLLAETKPPKINEAQFLGSGAGNAFAPAPKLETSEQIEQSQMQQQEENNQTESLPFGLKVNITPQSKQDLSYQKARLVCDYLPNNPLADAFNELQQRKRYFISISKYCLYKKYCHQHFRREKGGNNNGRQTSI